MLKIDLKLEGRQVSLSIPPPARCGSATVA